MREWSSGVRRREGDVGSLGEGGGMPFWEKVSVVDIGRERF